MITLVSLDFWAATDVGRTREHNEDNFLVARKLNLFVVADGMGGHAAGEVASNVAVREAHRVIAENESVLNAYKANGGNAEKEAVLVLVEKAISTACATVFNLAKEDPSKKGMGTTLSLMLVIGNRGFIGHVGDSRIYLVRRGDNLQLTEDHSLINELIKRGKIRADEAGQMPFKNAVTRAVGVYEKVEVDTFDIDVMRGDKFLLCSDGLSGYLDEEEDALIPLLQGETKEIPDACIRFANENGGKDNITAVYLTVKGFEEAAETSEELPIDGDSPSVPDLELDVDDDSPYLERLRLEPIFAHCAYSDLIKIAAVVEEKHLSTGTELVASDGKLDGLYICREGRLEVPALQSELEVGQSIGSESLLGPVTYQHRIMATLDTRLMFISGVALRRIMAQNTRLGWRLLFSLGELQARQIYQLSERLGQLGADSNGSKTTVAGARRQITSSGLPGVGYPNLDNLPEFLTASQSEGDDAEIPQPSVPVDRKTIPVRKTSTGRGVR